MVFSYSTHTCKLHAAQDFQLNHFKRTTLERKDAFKFVTNLAPSVVSGHFIKYNLTTNILNITFFHRTMISSSLINHLSIMSDVVIGKKNLPSSTHSSFINYISHANSFSYWHMPLWWYATVLLLVSYLNGVLLLFDHIMGKWLKLLKFFIYFVLVFGTPIIWCARHESNKNSIASDCLSHWN